MRIKIIHVEKFRGIPSEIDIDLTDDKGDSVSTVNYGDNDWGQSFIVDTIEFNTQGSAPYEQKQVLLWKYFFIRAVASTSQ